MCACVIQVWIWLQRQPKTRSCPVQCCNKAVSGQFRCFAYQRRFGFKMCCCLPMRACQQVGVLVGSIHSLRFILPFPRELANWKKSESVIDSCPWPGHCLLTFPRPPVVCLQSGAERCHMTCMWKWPASSGWVIIILNLKKHKGACQVRCTMSFSRCQWN